jgi:hypothetical protein
MTRPGANTPSATTTWRIGAAKHLAWQSGRKAALTANNAKSTRSRVQVRQ